MNDEKSSTSEPTLQQRFPRRAGQWKIRTRTFSFTRRPLLMGVVNVTPDSFSDGEKFFQHEAALEQALRLEQQGAKILDIGGESTRPDSTPIDAQEEQRRVLPVVKALCQRTSLPVSIDTSKAAVARAAIDAGAEIINDITGLQGDAQMIDVARQSSVGVCVMHMQGTPRTMQDNPTYDDVVSDIYEYLRQRRDALVQRGIDPARICLDPGIGFGKTHQHNLTLLAASGRFHELGCPVLIGHSRKRFLGKLLGDQQADRTAATVGTAMTLARQGVQIIRVHDVAPVWQALLAFEASGGIDGRPLRLS